MKRKFRVSAEFAVSPERLYEAWLSSAEHSAMTGSTAAVERHAGGKFSAWEGYITGTTLELEPSSRIVQAWRTSDFPEDAPDSKIEIALETIQGGTRFTLTHSGIPEGQAESYEAGWEEWYFAPMREYFGH